MNVCKHTRPRPVHSINTEHNADFKLNVGMSTGVVTTHTQQKLTGSSINLLVGKREKKQTNTHMLYKANVMTLQLFPVLYH